MNKKFVFGCVFGLVGVIVIIGLILAGYIVDSRNNMVSKEVEIDNAWAQVQNVYQRRLDLIPNLVNSVEAYMKLEKDIFEKIAEARQGTQSAASPGELESANEQVSSLIRDLKVVVEDTPELKASSTVADLMTQLEGTENRIAVERKRFNDAVRDYNTYIKLFPRNIIASWFNFSEREFFEAVEGAEIAPEVNIDID